MSEFDKYNAETVFQTQAVRDLCSQLALALRAAAAHRLSEGVCNHMSMAVPDTRFFLLNPRGLLWSEVRGKDIVIVDESGTKLAGLHEVMTLLRQTAFYSIDLMTLLLRLRGPPCTSMQPSIV